MSEYDFSANFYINKPSEANSIGIVDNIILKDDRRQREVPIKIYYPQESGSFPVIIFSHGAGGSKESFSYLSKFLTSYGYICIHPTHVGSDLSVLRNIGLQALLETTNNPDLWSERPQDISFLIDSLAELEQQVPQIKGKINQFFIGVSGHSYGAYTTMLLAGAVIAMPGNELVSFQDDRITAFLGISPPGTGRQGLMMSSWDKINAPMMTVSGTKDRGMEGKPAAWRMEAFKAMPPVDKYHVLVKEANHFSFDPDALGARMAGQRIRMKKRNDLSILKNEADLESKERVKNYLESASIAFWDAYLKFNKSAKEYLYSDALQTHSNGNVTVFLK